MPSPFPPFPPLFSLDFSTVSPVSLHSSFMIRMYSLLVYCWRASWGRRVGHGSDSKLARDKTRTPVIGVPSWPRSKNQPWFVSLGRVHPMTQTRPHLHCGSHSGVHRSGPPPYPASVSKPARGAGWGLDGGFSLWSIFAARDQVGRDIVENLCSSLLVWSWSCETRFLLIELPS